MRTVRRPGRTRTSQRLKRAPEVITSRGDLSVAAAAHRSGESERRAGRLVLSEEEVNVQRRRAVDLRRHLGVRGLRARGPDAPREPRSAYTLGGGTAARRLLRRPWRTQLFRGADGLYRGLARRRARPLRRRQARRPSARP